MANVTQLRTPPRLTLEDIDRYPEGMRVELLLVALHERRLVGLYESVSELVAVIPALRQARDAHERESWAWQEEAAGAQHETERLRKQLGAAEGRIRELEAKNQPVKEG